MVRQLYKKAFSAASLKIFKPSLEKRTKITFSRRSPFFKESLTVAKAIWLACSIGYPYAPRAFENGTNAQLTHRKKEVCGRLRHRSQFARAPVYDVEDASLIPPFATKQSCRWFTKDGSFGWKDCLVDSKVQSSCVGCANNW